MNKRKSLLFLTSLLLTYKAFASPVVTPLPNHYAIQLSSCKNKSSAVGFIKRHKLTNKASYFKTKIKGKDWYVLVYGHYNTASEAKATIATLPKVMRDLKPIIMRMKISAPITNINYAENNATTKPINHIQNTQAQPFVTPAPVLSQPVVMATGFTLYPKLNVDLFSGDKTVGKGQFLFPFGGNADRTFFAAFEGAYTAESKNGWMSGAGLGYRKVVKDRSILGAYVLGDYSQSPLKNHFWVINPGIENLWQNWDIRINGYIPVGDKTWKKANVPAEDIGKYNDVFRTGHVVKEGQYKLYEQVGYGADAEIGVAIPIIKRLKIHAGGYYFKTEDLGEILGAEGRLAYAINDYFTLEARDTYDDYNHNTLIGGLRIALGGVSNKEHNDIGISGRLMDPIEHNLATSAVGYAVPVKTDYVRQGSYVIGDNLL